MSHTAPTHQAKTQNARLRAWVEEVAALAQPDDIHWCDGSADEYDRLAQLLVDGGTFQKLSEAKRPNSYLARSGERDVARPAGQQRDGPLGLASGRHLAGQRGHRHVHLLLRLRPGQLRQLPADS